MCDQAKYYSWLSERTTSNSLWNKPLNGKVWRKLARSMVLKPATLNQLVVGSIPTRPTICPIQRLPVTSNLVSEAV